MKGTASGVGMDTTKSFCLLYSLFITFAPVATPNRTEMANHLSYYLFLLLLNLSAAGLTLYNESHLASMYTIKSKP